MLDALMQRRCPTVLGAGVMLLLGSANAQPSTQPGEPAIVIDPLPMQVDLRPRMLEWKLDPRPQGARGTCSIFTTCASIEFALARATDDPKRLSPEFVNWAAGQAAGRPSDGNFFHNALAGFEKFGVCEESLMPYAGTYDPGLSPMPEAMREADGVRALVGTTLKIHWIVPWTPDRFGLDEAQFAAVQRTLADRYPVAAGSGHSRLLVGYRSEPAQAGGGIFITEDSALNRFVEVSYEFVRTQVADAFWIEAVDPQGKEPCVP